MAVSSQNLVLNPNFEKAKRCTASVGDFGSNVLFWSSPTYGTPDLFNSCSKSETGIPFNYNGFQNAFSGNKYAGFYLYTHDNYREYIQGELIDTLEAGEKYTISFYVSLAENSDFAIKDIGFLFSEKQIKGNSFTELSKKQLKKHSVEKYSIYNFDSGEYYDNKKEWEKLKIDFLATGYEKFFTIGNFKKNRKTSKKLVSANKKFNMSYYYIDLVSVKKAELSIDNTTKSVSVTDIVIEKIKNIELNKKYIFENVVFEFDSYELSDEAKLEIREVYSFLIKNNFTKISISGHTDAVGTSIYNQELSAKRAHSVAVFFKTLGLATERIHSAGYGDSMPIFINDTQNSQYRNRRVEFKIELSN